MTIQLLNIQNGEIVFHRLLLVHGRAFTSKCIKTTIPNVGTLEWPVNGGYFKVLLPLERGDNLITITGEIEEHLLKVTYQVCLDNPPMRIAILLASDSDGSFDVPQYKEKEALGLDSLIQRSRLAGYLFQAFTAEQMWRNGFGRRTFRLEEEVANDTIMGDDVVRWTAKVHIVRTHHTKAVLRDPRRAQQNKTESSYSSSHSEGSDDSVSSDGPPDLYDAFLRALTAHGEPFESEQQQFVMGLIGDSHYDKLLDLITAHAALGGGAGNLRLGMFGSHTTHAWPSKLSDVVSCFTDTTLLDHDKCGNDNGECGANYMAVQIGLGAWNHECGHLMTLTHTPSGHMSRGYTNFNRTFTTATPGNDTIPITATDEGGSYWHRRDIVRLRYHPLLRLPTDKDELLYGKLQGGPNFYALDERGKFLIRSPSPIRMIEVEIDGHPAPKNDSHVEFLGDARFEVQLNARDILKSFGPDSWDGEAHRVTIEIVAENLETVRIEDMFQQWDSSLVRDANSVVGFKGQQFGFGERDGTRKFLAAFSTPSKQLASIRAWGGAFLDGLEFVRKDGTRIHGGNIHGGANPSNVLHLDGDEVISKVIVRAGAWLDGIDFQTSHGRNLGWTGGLGGGVIEVVPPTGTQVFGFYGSGVSSEWMDSFGIIYGTREFREREALAAVARAQQALQDALRLAAEIQVPVARTVRVMQDDATVTISVQPTYQPTQSQAMEWACSACTFLNSPTKATCDICETPR
jgi:hypothetical protein